MVNDSNGGVLMGWQRGQDDERGADPGPARDPRLAGFGKGGVMTVTAGLNGGSVSCKVTVNGVVQKMSTASGVGASATCSNF